MNDSRVPARKSARSPAQGIAASELGAWFEEMLGASRFSDYCPNGLQVEGRRPIRKLVCGVTASLDLIRAASASDADALLVHHGWFWKGEDPRLVAVKGARVRALIESGMHLFAYHLPLDVHPEVGNNAMLGTRLGWTTEGRGGPDGLICWHEFDKPLGASAIAARLSRAVGQKPLAVGRLDRPIRRIAWCTGAAQDLIESAAGLGADAFLSGEISERTTHLARELGVVYFAAGHHATERFGVQALAARAAQALGLDHEFIDDPNPV
jgi:dinuclear metal center YbgI/SA1388 family protein